MSNGTTVIQNKASGNELFTIAKVDDLGDPVLGQKFVVNIGIRKAEAVLEHLEELKAYIKRVKQ